MKQQYKTWRREFSISKPDDWAQVDASNLVEKRSGTGAYPIARFERAGSSFVVDVAYYPDDEFNEFNITVDNDDGIMHGHTEKSFERAQAATSAILYMVNHLESYAEYRDDNWRHQLEDVEGRVENAMDEVSELQETLERTEVSIKKMKSSE